MRFWVFSVLAAAAMVSLSIVPARACTCASPPPPCEAYWEASAVFSGTVVEISETTIQLTWGDEIFDHPQRLVRFNVIDAYRNVEPGSVEVITGLSDTDCGYPFLVGEDYLVYAFRTDSEERLRAHICSRTRPLSDASEDQDYIAGLTGADTQGALSGVVMLYSRSFDQQNNVLIGSFAGAGIQLHRDGARYATTTDAYGRFHLTGIAPGRYRIAVYSPTGAMLLEQRLVIHPTSCARLELRVVERRFHPLLPTRAFEMITSRPGEVPRESSG